MFDDFRNVFNRYNNGHIQLIIINVVIYLVMAVIAVVSLFVENNFLLTIFDYIFSLPPLFSDYFVRPWTIFTYSFAHSINIFHIFYNMLGLYWFGKLFVEYLGSDKLIAVYVLGALSGGLLFLLMFNFVPYFVAQAPHISGLVGASAAVMAIAVAVATLLPDHTFFLFLLGPVKIKYIAGFYVIASFAGLAQANAGGDAAHLGGALIGFIYTKQLQAGINWGGWITATIEWFKDLFKPKPKVKVSYRSEKAAEPAKKQNAGAKASQEEIDTILDKISDKGYESLSKDEKEKLFNASKK